jgi:hypothetical protein
MAHLYTIQGEMPLQASLEVLARLGADYRIVGGQNEWTARDLLEWLQTNHPTLLSLPVYLIPPDANEDGAVFEVDLEGQAITDVPLYRIERRLPTISPL